MNRRLTALSLMALAGLAAPALAQDSVDKYAAGLPGDALDPWTTGVPNQASAYVVDLTPMFTSCGTRFGIAPLIKTSKTNPAFFGSLFSGSGISSTLQNSAGLHSPLYREWNTPGQGLNPIHNNPASAISPNIFAGDGASQFAVGMAEFSTDAGGVSTNNIIGGIVNFDPARPSRLYVTKYMAATNQTGVGIGDNAQFGMGTVDSTGNLYLRGDNGGG
ncbi:MAG: hypothetical protein IT434_06785, partial [Phycisphaerales bacterium]|nr:hypothetical protein [Phycisphaerales bacterium]